MCSPLEVQYVVEINELSVGTYTNVSSVTLLASRFPDQLLFREGMKLLVEGERWVMLEEEVGEVLLGC